MPTRSLKFKLQIPRNHSPEATAAREALWRLHDFTNTMVAEYEDLLLCMRQKPVTVSDGKDWVVIDTEKWREKLKKRLIANGVKELDIPECTDKLAELYRGFVKSAVKKGSGKAEDSRTVHGVLVSAESSSAGISKYRQVEALEPLLGAFDGDEDKWLGFVERKVEEDPALLKTSGSPPKWAKLKKAGNKAWAVAFREYIQEGCENDLPKLCLRLRELKALPLRDSFTSEILENQEPGSLSPWERMAFAMAVGHLNSWESWSWETKDERDALKNKCETQESWLSRYPKEVEALRKYEVERNVQLRETSLANEETNYTIGLRELRGWSQLREKLLKAPTEAEQRNKLVVDAQSKGKGKKFGGAELIGWLAKPEQAWLLDTGSDDVVFRLALANGLQNKFLRSKEFPLFTSADSRLHPRYAEIDCQANSNSVRYFLETIDGKIFTDIELPASSTSGKWSIQKFRFELAPSGQARGLKLEHERGVKIVTYLEILSQDRLDNLRVKAGGAALLFNRRHLEKRSKAELQSGEFGSVWLKIGADFPVDEAEEKRRDGAAVYLNTALQNRGKKDRDKLWVAGDRVVAVDLGIRTAASIAVFELVPGDDQGWGKCGDFAIRHNRSAKLSLPGEEPSKEETLARREAMDEIYSIRRSLKQLAGIRRLGMKELSEERLEVVEELLKQTPDSSEEYQILKLLESCVGDELPVWISKVEPFYSVVEKQLGKKISQWRRRTRMRSSEQSRTTAGGKSFWQLEYLELSRKILLSWDRHSGLRGSNESDNGIRRFNKDAQGTIAKNLLEHINKLKDDRIKVTADLIIQAARGRVHNGRRWEQKFEPAAVVVLEDLERYRFKTDRPRAENSQLMKWSHRSVKDQFELQRKVHPTGLSEVDAAFSSQYHAKSLTPGVRCHVVTKADKIRLESGDDNFWLNRMVVEDKIDANSLEVGSIIPMQGGELFVTLDCTGKAISIHADINAAQNIGRRALTGYAEPIRITARQFSASSAPEDPWFQNNIGARLGHYFPESKNVLFKSVPAQDGIFESECITAAQLKKLVGGTIENEDENLEKVIDELEEEEIHHEDVNASGARMVLFRDPSGVFFPKTRWVEAGRFWGGVRAKIKKQLRERSWKLR